MHLTPTTEVDVLRGTTTDEYGDEVDGDGVVYRKVPASIIERNLIVQTGTEGTPRKIRMFAARIPRRIVLQEGDRLRDRRTKEIYIVDAITAAQNPVTTTDYRVDLRRLGATNF